MPRGPPLTSQPSDGLPSVMAAGNSSSSQHTPVHAGGADLRDVHAPMPLEGQAAVDLITPQRPSTHKSDGMDDGDEPHERTALLGRGSAASSRGGKDGRKDDEEEQRRQERLKQLPWYRRPHAAYIHTSLLFMALGMGLLSAARIEQFTQIICSQLNEDALTNLPFDPTLLLQTPEQCRHSTLVQKRVAELNALIMVIMGVCCVCTTPFWGALSDRIGRKPCIVLNTLSFALADAILILVLAPSSATGKPRVPYRWLLLYPTIEGLVGGMGSGQSIMSAYIGDCTGAGSRAGTFSVMMGVVFAGIAIGPALGSLCIQLTHNPLAPFYVALVVHSLQTLFSIFIMPESLPADKKREARRLYRARKEEKANKTKEDITSARRHGAGIFKRVFIVVKAVFRPLISVFAPLALLAPRKSKSGAYDWSLPVLSVVAGLYTMMMSIYSIKMQYAQLKFGWSSIQLGNFLSLIGVTRIAALCIVIPLFIRLIRKPHTEPMRAPPHISEEGVSEAVRDERRANIAAGNEGASGFARVEDDEWAAHTKSHRLQHDYQFDLKLARCSIVIDISSYIALCFTQNATQFISFVMLQALGSGANPAISSLCLMFANPEETGSLMAAITVLQIFLGQVVAPILFNFVYASTVDFWPEAIFLAGVAVYSLVLIGLLAIRVRRPKWTGYSTEVQDGEHAVSDIVAESSLM